LEKSKNKNKKWHVFFLANQLYIIGKSKKNGMLLINGGSTFFLVSRFLNSNSLLSKKKVLTSLLHERKLLDLCIAIYASHNYSFDYQF
jgi:hypothetical protein